MDPHQSLLVPRIDTSTSWLELEDETVENRLLAVIAQVLDIDKEDVLVAESFADLGGDERSAVALRKACMHAGMDVKVKDILRCPTLAELQTCISPCARQSQPQPFDTAGIVEPIMVHPLEALRPSRLSVHEDAKGSHSRNSSQSSSVSQVAQRTEIEQALGEQKSIARIATVRPKAGLLEGKLIALLTLTGASSAQANPSNINLIPQSHALFAGTQVAGLRKTAASVLPPGSAPDIWIVLDGMPLTESGDLDMRRLRTWAQNINDDVYRQALSLENQEAMQPPASGMEKSLQRLVSKVLDVPQGQIGVNFSFGQLGGDEMSAMELVARCKHESIYLNATEALESNTLSDLASIAASRGGLAHKWDDETRDYFDLSPMQHLYFQTSMGGDVERRAASDGSYRFNQSWLLRFKKHSTLDEISAALEAVVGHHPMLRSRFIRTSDGEWMQRVLPEVGGSYALRHHPISSEQELEDIMERTQNSINIETGPVFAAGYITTRDNHQMLYLVAHHLAVDLPSWRIIIHDIDELLESGSLLSQRSMPFHKWVDLQKSDAQDSEESDLLPFPVEPGDYTYWGLQGASNTYGDAVAESFSLTPDLTSILQSSCNQVFKTDSVDIYLAALMLSFAQTFHDRPVPVVWNQEHGRDQWNPDIDISETVGWFTSLCPVSQSMDSSDDFINILRRLKDTRRSIPARGSRFFASRFYNPDQTGFFSHDSPFEVVFSYAGSLQHLERDNGVMELPNRTEGSQASNIGANVGRTALFEISAMIEQGSATVKFLYNRFIKDENRIIHWINNFESLLLKGIETLRYHPWELTLADVPHLEVTYEGLEKFNRQRLATLNLASVRDIETIYPVTAVQQSILISQAQRPETCFLHAIYEFASPNGDLIDDARICAAWQHVVSKHAALRTVFIDSVSETGIWDKIVLRKASPEMLFIDTHPAEDYVYELSTRNLGKLTPADNRPLHRLTVCKAPTRTFVKLDISTALCDSISIHILLHDLRRAYVTERAISDSAQFHYPQYLQFLNRVRQPKSLAFWRDKLHGIAPCSFPRLSVAPNEQRFVNACLDLEISSYELSTFSRTHKTTISAVLRLAWGIILRCFTGQTNVSFGYQTMGRDDSVEELRYAVGSFANTVTCNYELSSYSPLTFMLEMVDEQMAASLPHQHFTLAELHNAMGMKGSERLFNSCLTFTEEPAGLNSKFTTRTSFELKPVSLQQSFDMDVVINTRFSGGKLVVDMGQRIMSPEQAVNVANTFGKAIRTILTTPSATVGMVDLFSDRDYAQILAWNAESPAASTVQAPVVIHELVAKQAALQPTSQAICSWDGSLTYEQLEQEATKLAHHLVDAGVGPHSVVPVVMEKGRLAPVAMLAVLKSGAAFVPIDALELSMIQPIFERLNSRVAIASEHAAPVLGNLFDKVVILTDTLMNTLLHGQELLTSMAAPADPACILFVPTSWNEARGVSFSHTALATSLLGQGPAAKIGPLSRVMQLSSFNVDICITEIFATLIYGGCVCVPWAAERLQDFTGAVNRMQVNWTYMTPVLSRKLEPALMPSLKVVCFRTRSLDEDTYSPWHGKVDVILAYGSQDVCPLGISFLEALGPQHLRSIGRPFSGSLLVVNPEDHKKLMPIGAVGELVVEGPTLGCAHPNRESTMVPLSPLGIAAGQKARHFKTGHRVRYTEGGLMEFISSSRDDHEFRGKIVNTTQIEQSLRRCLGQGVDVIVDTMTLRGAKTPTVLVAFIELGDSVLDVGENLTTLTPTTRDQLCMARQLIEIGMRNTVPQALIPSIFIPVKQLPITVSLKVNRRRLQKMDLKPLPLTESEERMRKIWARVLRVEPVKIGAHDTFAGAGGDEIAAAQLVIACRREGIHLPIDRILQNPSLADLCAIEAPQVIEDASPIIPIPMPTPVDANALKEKEIFIEKVIAPKMGVESGLIRDASEATSVQIRYIETGMLRGRANINYLVFNFSGSVDSKNLEDACKAVVTIHPILRTGFVTYNRRVYQAVIKSPDIEFRRQMCPTWRLSGMVDKVIRKDQISPIAFSTPMTKFIFVDGGKQSALILRLSKAQYDDLSVALLVKDLKKMYDGTQKPPRRPTYCDFVRSSLYANSQGAEEYWRTLLEGAAVTQVINHNQPYQVSTNTKTIRRLVPLGSLSGLGISFETVIKAAWAMVLANLSASSDVVFGELIDGRHVGLLFGGHSVSGVMGPTINAIPVRVQFPDNAFTPLGLLQYVHAQRIASIPFENLGTLNIVEKCTPWPYWTRFSTLVQHQFEETAINPSEPKSFHLGSAACKFTIVESTAQDMPDLFVRSIVRGSGRVEISISFCAGRINEAFAEDALTNLCASVALLTSVSIMQPVIPGGYQYRGMESKIPLPNPSLPSSFVTPPSSSGGAQDAVSPELGRGIQNLISNTWTGTLNPRALGVPESQVHHAAFYDLWGSLIPAAQLSTQLNRELSHLSIPGIDTDVKISMEEIIEHATMLKQFELIVSKIKSQSATQPQKGKEKEKEADKCLDTTKPAAQTNRKKPGVNISVATVGSRLRRFASTVARSNSPASMPPDSRPAPTLTPPPQTPISPVRIGLASAMVADLVSPPKIINTGKSSPVPPPMSSPPPPPAPRTLNLIPREPPQLPRIPIFESIVEEESEASGSVAPMAREASSRGNASSADSMTDGSSATSNHTEEDDADATPTPALPPRLPNSPLIRTEEEDLVSPLSAASPKSNAREFDSIRVSAASPTSTTQKKNSVFSKTGMSPIVG
ncbi:hypothetical protein B0T17DRAFT_545875 [Bombardia bombarda]|uniref:Carrier domain-containing protein n=1 Tax=Bombardia bombarda TaxID=252184 RepID=A0AA39TR79_9PEZI|nr:hypothetical protein B0T17DRAFT_545875 [Bombardia bombarda]